MFLKQIASYCHFTHFKGGHGGLSLRILFYDSLQMWPFRTGINTLFFGMTLYKLKFIVDIHGIQQENPNNFQMQLKTAPKLELALKQSK